VSYRGAGTVEFLVGTQGTVSFLEVNTRLQVEHPVTEETTGVDLVRQQLLVADGLPLEVSDTPEPRGHAFEFRLNAEDPGRGFLPTPGTVGRFDLPGGRGVRVDAGVVAGSVVPGSYDSLLAKLVVSGRDRPEALRRARQALAELTVEGVSTVLPFHRRVVEDPAFTAEDAFGVHTRWIETECAWLDELAAPRPPQGEVEEVVRTWVELDGRRVRLGLPAALLRATAPSAEVPRAAEPPRDPGLLAAPVAGTLLQWTVEDGAEVRTGDPVAVVEAMKMETVVTAHADGVLHVSLAAGQPCSPGTELARIVTPG
jgi:acetyl-CoA/propionyl-CoA carboxylase biotin carboxyl carrier protein